MNKPTPNSDPPPLTDSARKHRTLIIVFTAIAVLLPLLLAALRLKGIL